jgi:hypothetical protein
VQREERPASRADQRETSDPLERLESSGVLEIEISGRAVYFTAHCHERMRLRRISEDKVVLVLQARSVVYPGKEGRIHILGTVRGRRIRVTVEETDTICNVVTGDCAGRGRGVDVSVTAAEGPREPGRRFVPAL